MGINAASKIAMIYLSERPVLARSTDSPNSVSAQLPSIEVASLGLNRKSAPGRHQTCLPLVLDGKHPGNLRLVARYGIEATAPGDEAIMC